jgi:hypothetical protein
MISDLDASLKSMLSREAKPGSELSYATISFATPDRDWRAQGSGLELNVYLYRALDNRELRSNERRPEPNPDGTVSIRPFPARLECSYVISAWNKASDLPGFTREEQEHRLLSQVLYVLWRNPTMPTRHLTGLLANADILIPIQAAQSDDMSAKPDFWTSLDTPVRPAITCNITVALDLDLDELSTRMSTLVMGVGTGKHAFTIGGTVRNAAAPNEPINDAWIRLDDTSQTSFSDQQGRFVIDRIPEGMHPVTVRAAGFKEIRPKFEVPNQSGSYDILLTSI